jgi:hypothetical protein
MLKGSAVVEVTVEVEKVHVSVVVILEWDAGLSTLFTSHLFLP